ncbi:MAG TPA: GIY-YIG nuclease family protein [Candidatus Paceibacterota bacterium]
MYYVYILKCKDGSLYTGITTDLKRRFAEHKEGNGGHYTRAKRVIKIVHTEEHPNKSSALKREAEIKGWTRQKKLELIQFGCRVKST